MKEGENMTESTGEKEAGEEEEEAEEEEEEEEDEGLKGNGE